MEVAVNDPCTTALGGGWTLTQLTDKAGPYYRVDGPAGERSYTEDEYFARMHAARLGWKG